MTPIDRFERQLPAALTDLADPRTPDYLTDILGRTARTRQRPAWASLERWQPMLSLTSPRLVGLLAAAALAIALLGTALIGGGGPAPAPEPSATPGPSPTAPPSVAPSTEVPGALMGGWVAPSRGTGPEDPQTTFIEVGKRSAGPIRLWVDRPGFSPILSASIVETAPGVLSLEANDVNGGCAAGDLGSYRWTATDDGQWLTFDVIEDACEARTAILSGTWQRSLAHSNAGGPGIFAAFSPFFTVTLPPGEYSGRGIGETDTIVTETSIYTFKVWKDIDAFADPCDIDAGRIDLEGMDQVVAYFNDDPRFEVTRQEEFTIDGRRAVEVKFNLGPNQSAPCWDFDGDPADKTGVLTYIPHAAAGGFWNGRIGTPGLAVVTEVDGVSLLFEPLTLDAGEAVDRATLETVRFLDALPTPPPG